MQKRMTGGACAQVALVSGASLLATLASVTGTTPQQSTQRWLLLFLVSPALLVGQLSEPH